MAETRRYEEVVRRRRESLSPEAKAQREVFAANYRIAMQVLSLREAHGLTQAQLAERCGIDQAEISRIERGSISPTTRTLQRVADALDADVQLIARAG